MPHPDWNERYTSGGPLPWDTGQPDGHLTELWRSGRLRARRVLEVGCGTGTNAVWLAQQGCEVLGLDVSENAVGRAQARARQAGVSCRFRVADFLAEELGEPPFDLVFDRGCFHLFDTAPERERFAAGVARLLAPQGRWLSIIGSTEGPAREVGPPRRAARDVVGALEPALQLLELRGAVFDTLGPGAPAAWVCLSGKREVPAQPSTGSAP